MTVKAPVIIIRITKQHRANVVVIVSEDDNGYEGGDSDVSDEAYDDKDDDDCDDTVIITGVGWRILDFSIMVKRKMVTAARLNALIHMLVCGWIKNI